MVRGNWVLAAVLGLIVGMGASQVFAQADIIEKRQKLMKSNSAANKAIKGAVKSKDYATVETKAKEIMGNADQVVSLFPKGSTKGKTKATDAIWDKSDEFAAEAKKLSKAAGELAAAAKSGDEAAVTAKVKALSGTCGGCHKPFRAKKYSE